MPDTWKTSPNVVVDVTVLYNILIMLLYVTASLTTAFTQRIILNRGLAEFNFSSIKCQALAHPLLLLFKLFVLNIFTFLKTTESSKGL